MSFATDFTAYAAQPDRPKSFVTIGNFDGCHRGHQSLVRRTLAGAAGVGGVALAVTFRPRPEHYFRPEAADASLFTEAQKTRALREVGLNAQIVQNFDEPFSRIGAEAFYQDYLLGRLRAAGVVVGDDFRFGHRRKGGISDLRGWCGHDELQLIVGDGEQYAGARISSTRVRDVLSEQGDAQMATAMLGRPYMLEGHVARGDQLGRQLNVPTANLEGCEQLIPRYGIYAGHVWLAPANDSLAVPPVMQVPKDAYPAVFSLGIRPTLVRAHPPVRIEAHLLSGRFGADELYGRRAGYYLSHWLRPEARFDGLEPLKAQIAADIADARRLLGVP